MLSNFFPHDSIPPSPIAALLLNEAEKNVFTVTKTKFAMTVFSWYLLVARNCKHCVRLMLNCNRYLLKSIGVISQILHTRGQISHFSGIPNRSSINITTTTITRRSTIIQWRQSVPLLPTHMNEEEGRQEQTKTFVLVKYL